MPSNECADKTPGEQVHKHHRHKITAPHGQTCDHLASGQLIALTVVISAFEPILFQQPIVGRVTKHFIRAMVS